MCLGTRFGLRGLSLELPTKGGIDGTVYGRGATATDSYLCHHMRRISNAIVTADAESIDSSAADSTHRGLRRE